MGISLAINNSCSPGRRGQLNGIVSSAVSVARAVGPPMWSATFAFSIEDARKAFPFDVHFAFYLVTALYLGIAYCMWDTNAQGGGVACSRLRETTDPEEAQETTHLL